MQEVIKNAIQGVLSGLGITDVDFVVEHPADVSHGDYATNVAMVTAKRLGKNPREIAEQIVARLKVFTKSTYVDEVRGASKMGEGDVSRHTMTEHMGEATKKFAEYVDLVTIAGPGFINFTLSRDFFREKIAVVLANPDTWGRNDSWKGKKVLVEYTDPNPFKEFHIGHLFTNTVGESIARLFIMNGADTKRINYQGDVGLHVAHAIYGMQQLGITDSGNVTVRDIGRVYALGAKAYKNDHDGACQKIREINKKIYDRSDLDINNLYEWGRELSLSYFEIIYEMIGTKFDAYFFESEAGPRGKELVLAHPEVFPESDGARIFDGEAYGLHTRVFLNKEGLPTYEAKELALAQMKEERLGEYDLSVISTANEITEYFKVLKKAMSFVYPKLAEKTEHIGHGTVRLTTGKMSSRTGDVVAAIDFIDEVADAAAAKMDAGGRAAPDESLSRDIALGAIKYATLHGNILQNSVFDKEKALSFEGDSGPYLQYTHARIKSVLEKAKGVGVTASTEVGPREAYSIEKILYRFEEVVKEALTERAPHKVAVYLTELAGVFNAFYGEEKIADPDDLYAPYKAALASAVATTLKNGLWTLGIKAPERM